jgi:lipoic acid synthetase
VDTDEPNRVANSVRLMQVKHCVITSVDRDDLKDGGSTIWAETINTIRKESPETTLETLIPDFRGVWENLDRVLATRPEVVSHNLETVRRLTKEVRIQAKYDRSLECLRRINEAGLRTKSGIMLGLGETEEDVYEAMADLLEAGVHILTLGQYLQPSRNHHPVVDWITPEQFAKYKVRGLEMGFKYIESGPLVRSSYHAEKHLFEF